MHTIYQLSGAFFGSDEFFAGHRARAVQDERDVHAGPGRLALGREDRRRRHLDGVIRAQRRTLARTIEGNHARRGIGHGTADQRPAGSERAGVVERHSRCKRGIAARRNGERAAAVVVEGACATAAPKRGSRRRRPLIKRRPSASPSVSSSVAPTSSLQLRVQARNLLLLRIDALLELAGLAVEANCFVFANLF